MTWEPRQLPDVTPESERYWRAASNGKLEIKRCLDCGNAFHYPRSQCPDCFGDTEWIEADGVGTVYSYSASDQVQGWPEDKLPHIMAYVELKEGPRMLTVIADTDADDIGVGTEVEVAFEDTEDEDIGIPVFVKTSDS